MSLKKSFFIFVLLIITSILIVYIYFFTEASSIENLKNKNIFLITLDTTRADHIGIYGKNMANTPNIDQIAKEGVVFMNCITQSPLTLPAHVSLFSATYPLYHNVRDNIGFMVPSKLEFISETLKKNGYLTSAFISSFVLHSKWGINQGFDFYSDQFDFQNFSLVEVQQRAGTTFEKTKIWIKKNKNKKFFTWIHLFDPHIPYDAPFPYNKYKRNPYRGEIEYMDHQIGTFIRFLKKEKLYKDSIIIIIGDHGEALGQHGESTHGIFVYDESVHVPLIIKTPYNFPLKIIDDLVELVDIAPTILDMQGIRKPGEYQGLSLLNLMLKKGTFKKKIVYSESYYPRFHYGWSELKCFYFNNHYKYIIAPEEELFNLKDDPNETKNLFTKHPNIIKKYKGKFTKFLRNASKNRLTLNTNIAVSEKDMNKLKSLGYLGNTIDIDDKKDLPDPKDKIMILDKISYASKLLEKSNDFDRAIEIFNSILKDDPDSVDTLFYLGNAYVKKKKFKKALFYYKESLKRKPDSFSGILNILTSLYDMGKFEEAIINIRNYLKMFPEDYNLFNQLGKNYFRLNQYDKAIETFTKAIHLEETNSIAYKYMGRIYLIKKDSEKAENCFIKALMYNKKLNNLYFLFGLLEDNRGNKDKAIRYYKKEIEINPESYKALFNLAALYNKMGQPTESEILFRQVIKLKPKFNIPYFMIAKGIIKDSNRIEEAKRFCERGIIIRPFNKFTILGYLILADIYNSQGEQDLANQYKSLSEKLKNKLDNGG